MTQGLTLEEIDNFSAMWGELFIASSTPEICKAQTQLLGWMIENASVVRGTLAAARAHLTNTNGERDGLADAADTPELHRDLHSSDSVAGGVAAPAITEGEAVIIERKCPVCKTWNTDLGLAMRRQGITLPEPIAAGEEATHHHISWSDIPADATLADCVLWCKTHNLPARECDPVDPETGDLVFAPIAAGEEVHEISIKDHATPIAAGGGETRTTIDLPLVNCPNCGIVKEPHDCRDARTYGLARNDNCPKHGTPIAAGGGEDDNLDVGFGPGIAYPGYHRNVITPAQDPDICGYRMPPEKEAELRDKYKPSSSDLVERLRLAHAWFDVDRDEPVPVNRAYGLELFKQAADTIQRLEGEKAEWEHDAAFWKEKHAEFQILKSRVRIAEYTNAALQSEIDRWNDLAQHNREAYDALQSERDRLREALEAYQIATANTTYPENHPIWLADKLARAALAGKEDKE
jgi:hypothetical protein